ncbi:MAG TPA: CMD domain protein [Microbacterium sp.]|uniref:CMD domain protein n=1 Tax=Microbacterium sp. UBA1097 TaxID=1946941 RepID=UPI000E9EA603|nr:CMD domain protein [Microbacterium sp. UBA1097]HBS08000.1 CMD domain protein [Microbacterium sp.]|tara:strand:- start:1001 stop:1642 length:642 start_codon:yes stop_codon:yes gene_type:complete
MPPTDVIDALAGIEPDSALDRLRSRRPESRTHAQGSYDALFAPADTAHASLAERAAVATFVASLHWQDSAVAHYRSLLAQEDERLVPSVLDLAERAVALAPEGPYGDFVGENAPESVPGPRFAVTDLAATYVLGDRLTAALEHAHLLTLHPRDAAPADLQRLEDAGWSATGIVTLSQLVAFLAFQLRVVAGLRALQDARAAVGTASTTEGAGR